MKRFFLSAVATIAFSGAARAAESYFVEPGRWGVETSISSWDSTGKEAMYIGPVYYSDTFEAVAGINSVFLSADNSSPGTPSPQEDIDIVLRVGRRWNLKSNDYFSAGLMYSQPLLGFDPNSVKTDGSFSTGPYIGIQKNFVGTPLQFTAFVMPYTWSRSVAGTGNLVNGVAASQATVTQQFFQCGGIGIQYLFE